MDDTKERILDSAERLYAEHGLQGASLREVTRDAGVNVAAVHYHFGRGDALLLAVLDRHIDIVNTRRSELFDALGPDPSVSTLMDAFLRPDIELVTQLGKTRPGLSRFVAHCYAVPPPEVSAAIESQFGAIRDRLWPMIVAAVPGVHTEELAWRLDAIVGLIVRVFAGPVPNTDGEAERLIGRLVSASSAILTTPTSRKE